MDLNGFEPKNIKMAKKLTVRTLREAIYSKGYLLFVGSVRDPTPNATPNRYGTR